MPPRVSAHPIAAGFARRLCLSCTASLSCTRPLPRGPRSIPHHHNISLVRQAPANRQWACRPFTPPPAAVTPATEERGKQSSRGPPHRVTSAPRSRRRRRRRGGARGRRPGRGPAGAGGVAAGVCVRVRAQVCECVRACARASVCVCAALLDRRRTRALAELAAPPQRRRQDERPWRPRMGRAPLMSPCSPVQDEPGPRAA